MPPGVRSAGSQPRSTQLRIVWGVTSKALATSVTEAWARTGAAGGAAACRTRRVMARAAPGDVRRIAGMAASIACRSSSVKGVVMAIGDPLAAV